MTAADRNALVTEHTGIAKALVRRICRSTRPGEPAW